jgi:hypothetical protein
VNWKIGLQPSRRTSRRSACACRRLDAANANARQRCRAAAIAFMAAGAMTRASVLDGRHSNYPLGISGNAVARTLRSRSQWLHSWRRRRSCASWRARIFFWWVHRTESRSAGGRICTSMWCELRGSAAQLMQTALHRGWWTPADRFRNLQHAQGNSQTPTGVLCAN